MVEIVKITWAQRQWWKLSKLNAHRDNGGNCQNYMRTETMVEIAKITCAQRQWWKFSKLHAFQALRTKVFFYRHRCESGIPNKIGLFKDSPINNIHFVDFKIDQLTTNIIY